MYCTIRRQTKTHGWVDKCHTYDAQQIFARLATSGKYERVEVVAYLSGTVLQVWNQGDGMTTFFGGVKSLYRILHETNTCALCGGLTGRTRANDAQCLCRERALLQSPHIELFLTPNKKVLCTTCNGRGWSPKEQGGRINYVLGAGGLEGALLGWGPNCKTCKGTGADSV